MIRTGYVYFLRNPHSGLVKVGCTGDLKTRIKTLERAAGRALELLAVTQSDDMHDTERVIQGCLGGGGWRESEWFKHSARLDAFVRLANTGTTIARLDAYRIGREYPLDAPAKREGGWTPDGLAYWGEWAVLL